MKALKILLAVLVLGVASSAFAGLDTVFLGTGRLGNETLSTSGPVTVNRYTRVTAAISSGATSISVDHNGVVPSGNFAGGELILILQNKVAGLGISSCLELDGTTTDGCTSVGDGKVGRWEFARIDSVSMDKKTLTLKESVVYDYDKDVTQVIYVPEYASLWIKSGTSVTATQWDGSKGVGGVIAFLVRNTLINDGGISADGAGFAGSQLNGATLTCAVNVGAGKGEGLEPDERANAGGGGPCVFGGGGGGGHGGKGGSGGKPGSMNTDGGAGGAKVVRGNYPGRLILGGGGGAGQNGSNGANGGGAIFIRAGVVMGSSGISANGADALNSASGGAGGGGAGGTIILRLTDKPVCPSALKAKGGKGGNSTKSAGVTPVGGGGGGGGGGFIFFQSNNEACGDGDAVDKGLAGQSGDGTARSATAGEDGVFPDPVMQPLTQPGAVFVRAVTPTRAGFVTSTRPTVTVEALADRKVHLLFDASPWTSDELKTPVTSSGTTYIIPAPASVTLGQGSNKARAIAEYRGLWSEEGSLVFTVDTDPPDTLIDSGPPLPPLATNLHTVRFVFSSPESNVTFQCDFNNADNWVTCDKDVVYDASGIAVPGGPLVLDEGTHNLRVRAIDEAGNWDRFPASRDWEFDWTAPGKPSVTDPTPNAFVPSGTYIIRASATAHSVLVYIDDVTAGVPATGNSMAGWSFTPSPALSNGLHRVRVLAKDQAGNASPFSDTVFFTVDTVDPSAGIDYPVGTSPVSDKPLVIRGTAEAGSTVTVTLSKKNADGSLTTFSSGSVSAGTVGASGEWRYAVPETPGHELSDGPYVVTAQARDVAGRMSPSVPREFTMDRRHPNTTLTCPSAFSNAPALNFTLGSDKPGVTYKCALNGDFTTTPIPCSGLTPLELVKSSKPYVDGPYTLLARAEDPAGNVDQTPAACSWTWDTTEPDAVIIQSGPIQPVDNSPLAVFRFQAPVDLSEPVTFKCKLDDAVGFTACTNPLAIIVDEGAHTLSVLARDAAGNETPIGDVATYSWSLSTTLPVARIIPREGTNNPTNLTSATFEFGLVTGADDTVSYHYIVNDITSEDIDAFIKIEGRAKTVTLSADVGEGEEKTYTIKALALDEASGLSTPPGLRRVYTWKVDRKPPLIELVGKPAEWERFPVAIFQFSAPGEESVAGFRCALSDCESTPTTTQDCSGAEGSPRITYKLEEGLREGRNCLSVWTQDKAGNLSAAPATHEWNLDTQKPAPPVIDASEGQLTVKTRFPIIKGEAEPFAEVSLFVVDGAPKLVATVGADSRGRWEAQITQELSDGSHGIQASSKDRAGNEGPSSQPVTVLVDSQSPASIIGGGVGCTASGPGPALLALLGLARVLYRRRRARRE